MSKSAGLVLYANFLAKYMFRSVSIAVTVGMLTFFSVASPTASAANWYVDGAVESSGDGSSWSKAWKIFSDIQWSRISPGDTVFISGGLSSQTYFETLTVSASGSINNPITITKGIDAGHNG